MRETKKIIELLGRKWELHKLNPLEGSNLLRKFVRGNNFDPQDFLSQLTDQEFVAVQKALLRAVYEIIEKEGQQFPMPVFNGDLLSIEFKSGDEAFVVTAVALAFNLQGFFDEGALMEFGKIVKSFGA